jgi:hypothetical protein
MTREDVERALARAGLAVPARELADVAAAAHWIDEMAARVQGPRDVAAEPAHVFDIPEP